MNKTDQALAIVATEAPPRTKASSYPEPYATMMKGREKRPLGDLFGLTNFGVNLTRIDPGEVDAKVRHAHATQDEFIYVLEGQPTLITNAGETRLSPGMCAGFKAGSGDAHQLVNRSNEAVLYLEVGDRSPGDAAFYPDNDIKAVLGADGKWIFEHKDGSPY